MSVADGIALVAAAFAGVALYFAFRAERRADAADKRSILADQRSVAAEQRAATADKRAEAALEIEIRRDITGARERIEDLTNSNLDVLSKTVREPDDERRIQLITPLLKSAHESYVNAYESACSKFYNDRIDKTQFVKDYIHQIRRLVEDKNFVEFFDPVKSKHVAILRFYKEHCGAQV